MRQYISVVVGVVGLWFFVPGLVSVVGSSAAEAGASPVPAMRTGILLGSVLLVGSVLLWCSRAQRGTGQQAAAGDERPQADARA